MNREYHKWYSSRLGRDMELLIVGHGGLPLLVFPTSMGRFFEYEDRGMIDAVREQYENGHLMAFCVDGVDLESWYNKHAHPGHRVWRHMQYESYVMEEVLPLIRSRNASPDLVTTGCSFGGYHALNIALRHPDRFTGCVSMSGAFDIHQFLDGYYNENCYFNCPTDYIQGMSDPWYLERYRRMKLVLAAGEHDICLGENYRMAQLLGEKQIPHWLDVWGNQTRHDWPWWHQMARKYLA